MLKVKFILKSGVSMDFECEILSTQVSNIDGSLAGYKVEGANREKGYPAFVNINDISAIFVSDEPEDLQEVEEVPEPDSCKETAEPQEG